MKNEVTSADLDAMATMCQWFQQRYDTLITQIDTLSYFLGQTRGHYDVDEIQGMADILTTNIDQSVDYLAPRAQALTQGMDFAGDVYFPVYEGENFYRLWQQLYNVSISIKARHSSWHFGPPTRLAEHYGSLINSSHVCRQ